MSFISRLHVNGTLKLFMQISSSSSVVLLFNSFFGLFYLKYYCIYILHSLTDRTELVLILATSSSTVYFLITNTLKQCSALSAIRRIYFSCIFGTYSATLILFIPSRRPFTPLNRYFSSLRFFNELLF